MKCWACGTKMVCGDSRSTTGGKVRRRRYDCLKCGEHTYTIERIVPFEEWDRRRRKDLRGEG